MKFRALALAALALVVAAALAACAPAAAPKPTAAPATAAPAATEAAVPTEAATPAELELTIEELAAYNGKDGQPAYVVVNGVIYDVTDVAAWKNGVHNGNVAGKDLTAAVKGSPHGESVLKDLPIVGKLK
ncbi:MAG: hypothetical protein GX647_11535 [Clostridiales bacterium]|jgi:predicted heme/steroid binding protein|nr:hypothetical protein [Clostridiales bacterium]